MKTNLRVVSAAALMVLILALAPIHFVSGAFAGANIWQGGKPPTGKGGSQNPNNNQDKNKDKNKGGGSSNGNSNSSGSSNASSASSRNASLPAGAYPQVRNVVPVALDDHVTLTGGRRVTTKVLDNDQNLNNGPVNVRIRVAPAFGKASVNSDMSITYQELNASVSGDNLVYEVCDKQKDCALATLYYTIRQPILHVGADTRPPEITWEAPVKEGEIYMASGETVQLRVDAKDNTSVVSVHFIRWDAATETYIAIETEHSAPFNTTLDTSTLEPGWNQIFARAYDPSGNASDYHFIWIYLQ